MTSGFLLSREIGTFFFGIAFIIGIASAIYLKRYYKRKQDETGHHTNTIGFTLGLIILLPILVFLALGSPLQFDYAVLGKFNLKGGLAVVPEFVALTLALSVYTATYIAEAIRSGIEAVDKANALYDIRDGENALAILSQYYQPRPFVIRGYGAGAEVTSAGVFADILKTLSR